MSEGIDTVVDGEERSGENTKRERSAIAFPYMDLQDAIAVAKAIHDNVGLGTCEFPQLAAWLGQSAKSSGLRVQVSTARMFGLLAAGNSDYRVSDLGRRVIDPAQQRAAKVQAFLNVPLYAAVYEKYKGGVLPPANALEQDMVGLGVAQKQKDKARQAFERSAEQAGFFESGRDRLVKPGVRAFDAEQPPSGDEASAQTNTGAGNTGPGNQNLNLDPLIMALLHKIPTAQEGWPKEKRLRWFRTFAMNVSQIYDTDDDAVELSITTTGQG